MRLRFEHIEGGGDPLRRALVHLTRIPPSATYQGTMAGTRILVRLREAAENRVRITFTPRMSERNASKVVSRLGLDVLEGTWL
jgi:hypothetical protein